MRNHIPDLGRLLFCVAMVAACPKPATQGAAESAAPAPPPATATTPPGAGTISFADVAGKWNMRSVPESGDTTPTTYVLEAKADSAGWMLRFPNGPNVPVHAIAAGDSIVMHAGPYASVRRKGVQVTTESVLRRQGDRVVGATVAHYKTTGPDSVLRLRSEGTRAP